MTGHVQGKAIITPCQADFVRTARLGSLIHLQIRQQCIKGTLQQTHNNLSAHSSEFISAYSTFLSLSLSLSLSPSLFLSPSLSLHFFHNTIVWEFSRCCECGDAVSDIATIIIIRPQKKKKTKQKNLKFAPTERKISSPQIYLPFVIRGK